MERNFKLKENQIRWEENRGLKDKMEKAYELWPQVTTENLFEKTDYADYKKQFLQLFGFEVPGVDYTKDVNPEVAIDNLDNLVG